MRPEEGGQVGGGKGLNGVRGREGAGRGGEGGGKEWSTERKGVSACCHYRKSTLVKH